MAFVLNPFFRAGENISNTDLLDKTDPLSDDGARNNDIGTAFAPEK
jgi:hypothetical protein